MPLQHLQKALFTPPLNLGGTTTRPLSCHVFQGPLVQHMIIKRRFVFEVTFFFWDVNLLVSDRAAAFRA